MTTYKILTRNGKILTRNGKVLRRAIPDVPTFSGFRLPTAQEWEDEIDTWDTQDAAGAFGSVLK
ncbi:MAG: hypothetical protein EA392_00355, partial [Cryomorphaceae bacterium]